jgi:hypothetical protein
MDEIDPEEASSKYGISTAHHLLPNAERRFRLLGRDGSAYIRTEAGDRGGWQESHYHASNYETFIVQHGWVAYAERVDGANRISLFSERAVFTAPPKIIHNIYMSARSVMHTVKYGECVQDDWNTMGASDLQEFCLGLDEGQILAMCRDQGGD